MRELCENYEGLNSVPAGKINQNIVLMQLKKATHQLL
jgi:hypothetical protein